MSRSNVVRMGRPPLYTGNLASHIVALVRKYNASKAMAILNARNGTELAALRNAELVTKGLGISMPTILKLAKAAKVELRIGRPRQAA